mmetsp:Transcript_78019/g.135247  ORF Transcript_78019/g.135247 Transcript_78019/m.135247 type:complete len:196 (+) Transcript_78019:48-635(+)
MPPKTSGGDRSASPANRSASPGGSPKPGKGGASTPPRGASPGPVGSSLPSRVPGLDARGVFLWYDSNEDGMLSQDEFLRALQASGAVPTAKDFEDVCKKYGKTPELPAFLEALRALMKERPDPNALINQFKVVDGSSRGSIEADDLRMIVTQYGERLSEAEVAELMRLALPDGGTTVYLEDLATALLTPPSHKPN